MERAIIRQKLGIPFSRWAKANGYSDNTVRKALFVWSATERNKLGHGPTGVTLEILVHMSREIGEPVSPALEPSLLMDKAS